MKTNFSLLFYLKKPKNYQSVYYGDVDHPVPGQIDHWVS